LLAHATQNKDSNSFNTGIVYGDYYFLQAIERYEQITKINRPKLYLHELSLSN